MRKKILIAIIASILIVSAILFTIPRQEQKANPVIAFNLAEWDYPDDYSNGIYAVRIFENSSGAWMHYDFCYYSDTGVYEWNSSMGIFIQVYVWMNNTLIGATDYVDGEDYQRVNVTVTDLGGTEVFNSTDLTFAGYDGTADPMWLYVWEVELEFTPTDGQYYTVEITYELWW